MGVVWLEQCLGKSRNRPPLPVWRGSITCCSAAQCTVHRARWGSEPATSQPLRAGHLARQYTRGRISLAASPPLATKSGKRDKNNLESLARLFKQSYPMRVLVTQAYRNGYSTGGPGPTSESRNKAMGPNNSFVGSISDAQMHQERKTSLRWGSAGPFTNQTSLSRHFGFAIGLMRPARQVRAQESTCCPSPLGFPPDAHTVITRNIHGCLSSKLYMPTCHPCSLVAMAV